MTSERLGRTNTAFPTQWQSLRLPEGGAKEDLPEAFIAGVRRLNTVIDISTSPAYWGGRMRGGSDLLMVKSGLEFESAPSRKIACDLLQAHLVETLSAIGREWIDFYFLRIRSNLPSHQIEGALEAIELARQEGHIRFVGIAPDGDLDGAAALWESHDAFEVALLAEFHAGLVGLARTRRCGIISVGGAIPDADVRLDPSNLIETQTARSHL